MKRESLRTGLLCGGLVLALAAAAGAAVPYRPLSTDHTLWGVSQYVAGFLPDTSYGLSLHNPTPVTMIAGVLVYERAFIDDDSSDPSAAAVFLQPDGDPGYDTGNRPARFAGCFVVELEPHADLQIDNGVFTYSNPNDDRSYLEIISVPAAKVRVRGRQRRMADGLGIVAEGRGDSPRGFTLVHPSRFERPRGRAAGAANRCLCRGATLFTGDKTLWRDFKVNCR